MSTMIYARASYMSLGGETMCERELARRVRVRLQPVGVREAGEIRDGMRPSLRTAVR